MSSDGRRGPRGEATRRAILEAARALFAERGFHRTTVPDIVKRAEIGHGTFYEYFRKRHDVLLELVREAGQSTAAQEGSAAATFEERVRDDVERFLRGYVSNLDLSKIWVEAAAFDPEVAEMRSMIRAGFVSRIRRGIESVSPPGLDPATAAVALAAMTEHFAYVWFVEGVGGGTSDADVQAAADTLTRIWVNALTAAPAPEAARG